MKIVKENHNLTIYLSGHLDTSCAATTDAEIKKYLEGAGEIENIVVDAQELEYISSSGLRIILAQKKKCANTQVINLQPEVYNVFEMTGFSRILNVSKAFRQISIEGCKEIGRGGVGVVYRMNEDTILKVFTPECPLALLERERNMAKEAFVLGMPTAIPFDTVWVKETKSYGLVFELISSGTLANAIKEHPEKLMHYATLFGNELRHLHTIEVPDGVLPLTHEVINDDFDRIARHFLPEQMDIMREMQNCIPVANRLLHNDCHPKNIMFAGNEDSDEILLIDMGEVSSGNPLIDLSHTYSSLHIRDNFEGIIGFPKELSEPFWQKTLSTYFQTTDEEFLSRVNEQIKVAAEIRTCAWIALSDFPEETIKYVRDYADQVLIPQKEYLLKVARTFKDFPVL